jgi:2-methylisocitrate lyase-like PEP mutase family enzyme
MSMVSQAEKAALFLQMHHKGSTLLLPNAWDVASACVFEAAGFPAIGTTSAGVAFANGYPDGQQIRRDEMLAQIKRMVAAVDVPVSADIEAGYGPSPDDVAATIKGVIDAGGAGVNLEDNNGMPNALYGIEAQEHRLKAARDTAGSALVINARIDTFLHQVGPEANRLEETLLRAKAYLAAGADCIFVPGVVDAPTIEKLVSQINAPLNIMAGPGAPSAPELFKLGVARVSVGVAAMLATMGLVRDMANELRQTGTYEQMAQHPFSYPEASKLFAKKNT